VLFFRENLKKARKTGEWKHEKIRSFIVDVPFAVRLCNAAKGAGGTDAGKDRGRGRSRRTTGRDNGSGSYGGAGIYANAGSETRVGATGKTGSTA
jgi:hypothetical protein